MEYGGVTPIALEPVEKVEIITLYDNMVDASTPACGPGSRLSARGGRPSAPSLERALKHNGLLGA